MKRIMKLGLALGSATALALSLGGCWSDNDTSKEVVTIPPAPTDTVPDSAGATIASFVAYLRALATGDETTEPLKLNNSFRSCAILKSIIMLKESGSA